jgi:hypothetical protein
MLWSVKPLSPNLVGSMILLCRLEDMGAALRDASTELCHNWLRRSASAVGDDPSQTTVRAAEKAEYEC